MSGSNAPVDSYEVSVEQAAAMREAGQLELFLDVRTPQEVATAAIDGAEVMEMQSVPSRLAELKAYRNQRAVVFCHGGVRSLRVTEFLRDQGFTLVWSMAGGIDAWSQRIDPSVPRY